MVTLLVVNCDQYWYVVNEQERFLFQHLASLLFLVIHPCSFYLNGLLKATLNFSADVICIVD